MQTRYDDKQGMSEFFLNEQVIFICGLGLENHKSSPCVKCDIMRSLPCDLAGWRSNGSFHVICNVKTKKSTERILLHREPQVDYFLYNFKCIRSKTTVNNLLNIQTAADFI